MQRERERERQGARPREEVGGAQEALLGAGAGAGEGASVAENGTVAASGTAADGGEANTVEAHVGGGAVAVALTCLLSSSTASRWRTRWRAGRN